MHDVILNDARLYKTLFDDVFMDRARMERARIDYSEFWGCHIPDASLREARLDESRFSKCDLARADFSESWFVDGGPDACELEGNDMRDTIWRGAIVLLFTGSRDNDVDGADFRGAWMSCIQARFGFALGFVLPRTFRFGPRTRLPCAPLPYAYAYPRTAAALLGLGTVAAVGALMG